MVLRQFAERVIKAARLNLGATRTITYNDGKKKRRRQVSSGKLKDSLDYDLTTGVHLLMSFKMADYGKYIDEGVAVQSIKYRMVQDLPLMVSNLQRVLSALGWHRRRSRHETSRPIVL